jgi:hypothetical protein
MLGWVMLLILAKRNLVWTETYNREEEQIANSSRFRKESLFNCLFPSNRSSDNLILEDPHNQQTQG